MSYTVTQNPAGTVSVVNEITGNSVLSADSADAVTLTASTITTLTSTAVNATTVDATNLEVTNIKAKDGTASITMADSTGVVTATKQVVLQDAHSGLLIGCGASGSAFALGATADNAVEYYLDATHTTGDMRGEYLRLYFSGAGGSGEAARIFGTINNVSVATGGTVNGAHISLGTAGASAAVSGAANALRCTFGIAAASTNIGGTCAVIQVDTDMDTAVTVPSNFAFLRFTDTNVKLAGNLMNIPNVSNGSIFAAHTTQTMSHSIRIVSADGTVYYIMCTNAATNRS